MILEIAALLGLGASAVGQALGIAGQNEQITAEQKRLRQIAYLQRQRAGQIRSIANQQAGRVITAGSQTASRIKTAIAAGGLDPTAGTAAANVADAQVWATADALQVQLNAAKQARGLDVAAEQATAQAAQLEKTRTLANIGAGLGLGATVAQGLYGLNKEFNFFGGDALPPSMDGLSVAAADVAQAPERSAARLPGETLSAYYAGRRRPVSTAKGRSLWASYWE